MTKNPGKKAAGYAAGALAALVVVGVACKTRKFNGNPPSEAKQATSSGSASAAPGGEWANYFRNQNEEVEIYLGQDDGGTKFPGEGFRWFREFPLGFIGPPLLLFKALPAEFPDIFGAPEEKYRAIGFGHTPPDDWVQRTRSLPLGLGYTHTDIRLPATAEDGTKSPLAPPVAVTVVSCGGCHIGRVKLRSSELDSGVAARMAGYSERHRNGGYIFLAGAPNTAFDANRFRHAFERMIASEAFRDDRIAQTSASLFEKIKSQDYNELYGDTANVFKSLTQKLSKLFEDKVVYKDAKAVQTVLERFKARVAGRSQMNTAYEERVYKGKVKLSGTEKGKFNGTPGQLDAFGLANSVLAGSQGKTPEEKAAFADREFPENPAMSDIMSVWTQNLRPYGNWNGNMKDKFYRNLGASFGGVADANAVDIQNSKIVTTFLENLPPPPYPYNVETGIAFGRGRELFNSNCAQCHGVRSDEKGIGNGSPGWKWANSSIQFNSVKNRPFWLNVGTDEGRTKVQKQPLATIMREGLKAGCGASHIRLGLPRDKAICDKQDNDIVSPISPEFDGYIPLNMTGLWARAPYLHNGSVPTLRALLTPPSERPKRFVRGVQYFDPANVGFVWKLEADSSEGPTIEQEFGPLEKLEEEFTNLSIYDTSEKGNSNLGHYNMRVVNLDKVTSSGADPVVDNNGAWPTEKQDVDALIEYLKTF